METRCHIYTLGPQQTSNAIDVCDVAKFFHILIGLSSYQSTTPRQAAGYGRSTMTVTTVLTVGLSCSCLGSWHTALRQPNSHRCRPYPRSNHQSRIHRPKAPF